MNTTQNRYQSNLQIQQSEIQEDIFRKKKTKDGNEVFIDVLQIQEENKNIQNHFKNINRSNLPWNKTKEQLNNFYKIFPKIDPYDIQFNVSHMDLIQS